MRAHVTARLAMLLPILLSAAVTACSERTAARDTTPALIEFSRIDRAHGLATGRGVRVAVVDWQFDLRSRTAERFVDPTSVVPGEDIGALKPWHGAWMADLVGAVAPEALIIPIKAKSLDHRGFQDTLPLGIRYAADHGAAAVTSSMGEARMSDALRDAIDYAEARGTIFVNVHPEVIEEDGAERRYCAVGECDDRIVRAGIVSVPAHPVKPHPMRDVYTWPYDLEAVFQDGWGFSNAPPIVGGVIALMKSANPALTPPEIRDLLVRTAVSRDGFRVLDAEAAVRGALSLSGASPAPGPAR